MHKKLIALLLSALLLLSGLTAFAGPAEEANAYFALMKANISDPDPIIRHFENCVSVENVAQLDSYFAAIDQSLKLARPDALQNLATAEWISVVANLNAIAKLLGLRFELRLEVPGSFIYLDEDIFTDDDREYQLIGEAESVPVAAPLPPPRYEELAAAPEAPAATPVPLRTTTGDGASHPHVTGNPIAFAARPEENIWIELGIPELITTTIEQLFEDASEDAVIYTSYADVYVPISELPYPVANVGEVIDGFGFFIYNEDNKLLAIADLGVDALLTEVDPETYYAKSPFRSWFANLHAAIKACAACAG